MKVLVAYSTKTKNTKKVAEAIFQELKECADLKLLDIKKQKKKMEEDYDLYILGAWTDKTTANKNMQNFIIEQEIKNKNVALFLTCGVPREHPHAKESLNNYRNFVEKYNNNVIGSFVCQGKIDPKVLIVFKILTLKDPNFIHKVTPELVEMVKQSKTHPDEKDLKDTRESFREILEKVL